jgi:hypothetical protein
VYLGGRNNRPASNLFMHLSESIQRLQCLVDIEVQSVEDHQRDIGFFTAQLDQLNHDVQVRKQCDVKKYHYPNDHCVVFGLVDVVHEQKSSRPIHKH